MNFKNPRVQAAVFIAILAVIGYFAFRKPANNRTDNQNRQQTQEGNQTSPNQQIKPTGSTSNNSGTAKIWEGKLQLSNNTQKGNLMIEVDGHLVYVRTGRDYSTLVGKDVKVTYQGTLENFVLEKIEAK
jgi:FKBP-type peptidyl-prolyl cis-trans isomerase